MPTTVDPRTRPNMSFAHPASSLAGVARPWVWISAVAFLTGFLLSLAAHLGQVAGARDAGPILRPTIVDTAPQPDLWNAKKAI
jgi:hypothetical protein